jgi:Domain of unknown function (DUF4055)
MSIDTESQAMKNMRLRWGEITALLGGTKAMREAGELYLPKHPAEEAPDYEFRLRISTLYNVFGSTIVRMAAKPFSAPAAEMDGSAKMPEEWAENIDMQGRSLEMFARTVFEDALAYGLSHILVDFPRREGPTTLADDRRNGYRPYMTHFKAGQVVGWRSVKTNGYERLVELRLRRKTSRAKGDFEDEEVEQILLFQLTGGFVSWSIWEYTDKGTWQQVDEGIITLPYIPFATVYTKRTGFMTAEPPLLDMAFLNIQHWQSTSDQDNILHVARVPILYGAGFPEAETGAPDLEVGASKVVRSTNPEAKLAYVEHSGAAIEAGRQSIMDLEDRMQALGAILLQRRQSGDKTATESSLESAEETCELAAMAENLEDALNLSLEAMASFQGKAASAPMITLFKDFAVSGLGAADLDVLIKLKGAGALSTETLFAEAQRRNLVTDDVTWEDEEARIGEDNERSLALMTDMTAAGGDPEDPDKKTPPKDE